MKRNYISPEIFSFDYLSYQVNGQTTGDCNTGNVATADCPNGSIPTGTGSCNPNGGIADNRCEAGNIAGNRCETFGNEAGNACHVYGSYAANECGTGGYANAACNPTGSYTATSCATGNNTSLPAADCINGSVADNNDCLSGGSADRACNNGNSARGNVNTDCNNGNLARGDQCNSGIGARAGTCNNGTVPNDTCATGTTAGFLMQSPDIFEIQSACAEGNQALNVNCELGSNADSGCGTGAFPSFSGCRQGQAPIENCASGAYAL